MPTTPHILEWLPETLSAAISGLSVMAAVLIYRRTRLDEEIRQVRLDLRQAPTVIRRLASAMSESGYNEVALEISKQLSILIGIEQEAANITSYLKAPENHNFLIQAIYEGVDNADICRRIEHYQEKILLAEYQIGNLFPSIGKLIKTATVFIDMHSTRVFGPTLYISFFQREEMKEFLYEYLEKSGSPGRAYAEIADYFSNPPRLYLEILSEGVCQQAVILMLMCVNRILEASDAELRKLRKHDNRVMIDRRKLDSQGNIGLQLIYALDQCRPLFPQEDQAALDAIKTFFMEDMERVERLQEEVVAATSTEPGSVARSGDLYNARDAADLASGRGAAGSRPGPGKLA